MQSVFKFSLEVSGSAVAHLESVPRTKEVLTGNIEDMESI